MFREPSGMPMLYRIYMEFGWSSEVEALYQEALDFARRELQIDSAATAAAPAAAFPLDKWKACGNFGALGLSVPEGHGGLGLGALDTVRIVEALGRGTNDMGFVFSAMAHLFACVMPIVEHASEAISDRFVAPLASGKLVGANAMTEAEAGSDIGALKARAVRDGGHYVIDGVKTYVTNGPVADVFVVYASTNPQHGHYGISGFVVPKDTPGLEIGEPFSKMGLTTSPISCVVLNECRVPVEHRLGDEGAGAKVFSSSMQWERACLFGAYVGMMERQLDQAVEHAKSRKQFRKPIGKNQAISHRLADMKLRLEAARLLLYRACWRHDQGCAEGMDISMAKTAVSEAAVQCALDSIQIHGGMGFMRESGVEVALRDAVPSTLFSGTSEIQRDMIARGLGL